MPIASTEHTQLNKNVPECSSRTRMYIVLCSIVFLIVFAAHLLRLVYGWQMTIAGVFIPMWISWVAMIAAAFLSSIGFKIAGRKGVRLQSK